MRFMLTVHVEIPPELRAELPALRAREDQHIDEQLAQGALEAIYHSAETPPTIWAVMRADSLEDAQRQAERYPMYPYLRITYAPLG